VVPDTYKRVLAIPRVRLPLTGTTISRLPFAAEALALLLLVQEATGSFAEAGLVNACYSLGMAVGLPAQGRIVDRAGQTKVIVASTAVNAAALIILTLLAEGDASLALMSVAATAAGIATPPLATCMRTLWSTLVEDAALRQIAFALDAVAVELGFILGPLLIALVIALVSPAAAVYVIVALSITGSALFAVSSASRSWRGQPHDLGLLGPLRSAGVLVLMGSLLGVGIAVAATELGATAVAADDGVRELGGALVATQAAGSLIGGLIYGSRVRSHLPERALAVLALVLAATTVPLVFTPSLEATFPLMLISGVALAPAVSVVYSLLDSVAPPGTASEATAWTLTAFVAGASAGAGLAGAAVAVSGPHAGLAIGLGGTLVTVGVALLGQRSLPPAAFGREQPFARVHSR
jgi:predicted MFS family arabinose efflux permease